jgi:tetratricopeptide (TPR) repeat protein
MICSGESRNNIKVIDFGLARLSWLSSELQKLTEAGTTLGTAQYMSPEQCTGAEVDSRSDIYAAGCILFKLLTGENAFTGEHAALMMQHLRDTPPRLSQYFASSKVVDELQLVLDKCMAKEPKDRYQTAAELIDDLNSISQSKHQDLIAEHARPPKAGGVSARVRVGLTMAVAVGLTLLGIYFYFQNQPQKYRAPNSVELFRQFQSLVDDNSYRHDHSVRIKAIPLGLEALSAAGKDKLLQGDRRTYLLTSLALSLHAEGRVEEALRIAQESIRESQVASRWDPQIQAAAEVARDCLTSLGQRTRGKELMQRVADSFPHEATTTPHYLHYDLAAMAIEDGDYETARHHLGYLEYYTPSDIRPGVLKIREQVAQHFANAKSSSKPSGKGSK